MVDFTLIRLKLYRNFLSAPFATPCSSQKSHWNSLLTDKDNLLFLAVVSVVVFVPRNRFVKLPSLSLRPLSEGKRHLPPCKSQFGYKSIDVSSSSLSFLTKSEKRSNGSCYTRVLTLQCIVTSHAGGDLISDYLLSTLSPLLSFSIFFSSSFSFICSLS